MGALDGLRVLDLGLLVQGPQAAATLADLGAEVIKVELPELGDVSRWVPLTDDDRRSAVFFACNRGKRSITLDLRVEAGKTVLRKLVETADVLISNFTPGTLEDWGLGYDELAAINPRLIYAAGSAFGPLGPEARSEGGDLGGQACSGLLSVTGHDGADPSPVGAIIADHTGSLHLVVGILAALHVRERTGRGQRIEVSLLGAMLYAQASEYTHYFLTGELPGRSNRGHPQLQGIMGAFPTADGGIAVVGVPSNLREGFYRVIGRPELAEDPRFAGLLLAREDKKFIFELLAQIFPTRTTAEWMQRGREEKQRFVPVRNYAEVVANPQVWENGYVVEADHPEWGRIPMVGAPIRLSDTPAEPAAFAPELGQNTEEVLLELGFDFDDIARLRKHGAI